MRGCEAESTATTGENNRLAFERRQWSLGPVSLSGLRYDFQHGYIRFERDGCHIGTASGREVQAVRGTIWAMIDGEHTVLYCSSDENLDDHVSMGAMLNHGICCF